MERRNFIQMLGLAPLAAFVARFLPKAHQEYEVEYFADLANGQDHTVITHIAKDWEANTMYNIGDIVVLNGEKRKVVCAGTTGSVKPLVREEFMEEILRWEESKGTAGLEDL
jgi:hypothetical protein